MARKTTRRNAAMETKGRSSQAAIEAKAPREVTIAYIGGGSRGWAHKLMEDLAKCPHMTGEVRLYDIDYQAAAFNAKYANWIMTHPEAVSKWRWRVVRTLGECLKGADFVFASIMPGPMEYMKHDLELPARCGIYHAVGDTVGPAGQIRSLRSIDDYHVIGQAVGEHAPGAWVLNFTNPMTVCTRTLFEAFPAVKAYGCCHEVFGTQTALGRLWAAATGNEEPDRSQVQINVLGVNHFTWVDRASCDGVDLIALLTDHIAKPGVLRRYTRRQVEARGSYFVNSRMVSWDLFRRFGVIGAAGDRHLAEFVPWYLTGPESCFRWGFALTPYSHRIKRWNVTPKHYRKQYESGEFPSMSGSGEEYVNQMLALLGATSFKTNVNLPNTGQMGKVPLGAVVETNAIFSRDSVEPVASGSLPDNVNTLVERHVHNQESLVAAAYAGDKDLAFQAFLNDPLVHIDTDAAWKLFNRMLDKTSYKFRAKATGPRN